MAPQAAALTPPGAEATLFACFMSLSNFARQLGSFFGVGITAALGIGRGQYELLWLALTLRTVLMLPPMLLVRRLVPPRIGNPFKEKVA